MDNKQNEGKSKRSEHQARRRHQEPPKFYSKNYLKRYRQNEVRVTTTTTTGQTNQTNGKKSMVNDQTSMCRSQPKQQQQQQQQTEQDDRYNVVNAISTVKSTCVKCGMETTPDVSNSESKVSIYGDDESCYHSWSKNENFRKIKNKVDEAIKHHKVFLLRGELPKLKEALELRGWIQKYEPSRTRYLPYGSVPNLEAKSLGDVRQADGTFNERALTFALLRHAQPDFIWDCRNDFIEWDKSIGANVFLNRLRKPGIYTSKLGMGHVLQEAHWLHETNVADVLFPRSYNPGREFTELARDFRRCAALALLRRFVETMRNYENYDVVEDDDVDGVKASNSSRQMSSKKNDEKSEKMDEPSLLLDQIEFAIRCCKEQIAEFEHEDIDIDNEDIEINEEEWQLFSEDCERLLYKPDGMANLPKDHPERLEACHSAAHFVLDKLKAIDPQFSLNGERNIWIVKPSNLCCGSGIFITHDLKTISQKVESKPKDYYVVQKYIERPFLVYGTKFDIRQWFLVTSTFPMTIWMFRSVGYEGEPYYDKIYPKMSQAIVLTMLAAQEFMDRRRCSFELYGADFMVMEDLSVWLIEINTNPRMHPPSSKITQRLYDSVLDSLVKVILDLPLNPKVDTGGFELAYKQSVPETLPYLGPCLFALGKSMVLNEKNLGNTGEQQVTNVYNPWGKQYRASTAPQPVIRQSKVVDFIDCLNNGPAKRARQQDKENSH